MAGDQGNLYIDLGRKLIWVQDFPDPLGGKSLPRLQEAITRLSRGGPLFVSMLSPDDVEQLSRLCDAVAAENGHTWWQRSAPGSDRPGRKERGFWRRRRS